MHGEINVESEYGKGSVFSITIPQTISENYTGDGMGTFTPLISVSGRDYSELFHAPSAEILIVDDVDMNIEVFKGIIKKTEVQVDSATSGMQCLEMTKTKKYDLIFMDHMMPEMDGIKTFNAIYSDENNPNCKTPVVVLTANAISGAEQMYRGVGFTDYISKPMNPEKLEKMILRLLPQEKISYRAESAFDADDSEEVAGGGAFEEVFSFLDISVGLANCNNDQDFYLEIMDSYLKDDKTQRLDQFKAEEKWNEYTILVHALKSTSATIGAMQLSEDARLLEQAAHDQDIDYILKNHDDVMAEYKSILNKLRESRKNERNQI